MDSAIYLLVALEKYKLYNNQETSQLHSCCNLQCVVKIPSSVSLRKRNHLWDLSRQGLHHYSLWCDFTQERVIDLGLSGFSCLAVLFNASA